MPRKLFGKKQPTQSQTFGNVTTNGGHFQAGQAGGDLAQKQSGQIAVQKQGITGAEVVALLERLMNTIQDLALTPEQKEELQDYLKAAKREAGKEEPDKDLIGKNLKAVGETMQTLKETTEAGKTLWKTGIDVFEAVAPWLGVTMTFFGL